MMINTKNRVHLGDELSDILAKFDYRTKSSAVPQVLISALLDNQVVASGTDRLLRLCEVHYCQPQIREYVLKNGLGDENSLMATLYVGKNTDRVCYDLNTGMRVGDETGIYSWMTANSRRRR